MGQVVGERRYASARPAPIRFFQDAGPAPYFHPFLFPVGRANGTGGGPAEDVRLRMAPSTGRMETWRLPPVLVWQGASETRPDFRLMFFQVSLLTSWGRMPAYSIRAQAGRHAPWNNCSAVWRSRFASYRERALMRFSLRIGEEPERPRFCGTTRASGKKFRMPLRISRPLCRWRGVEKLFAEITLAIFRRDGTDLFSCQFRAFFHHPGSHIADFLQGAGPAVFPCFQAGADSLGKRHACFPVGKSLSSQPYASFGPVILSPLPRLVSRRSFRRRKASMGGMPRERMRRIPV